MNFFSFSTLAASLAVAFACSASAADLNKLTAQEKAQGWRLLWDGKTTEGWRSTKNQKFPDQGWEIKHGVLSVVGSEAPRPWWRRLGTARPSSGKPRGGDLITTERFSSFELTADFKISPGGNSGIKYFIQSDLDPAEPGAPKRTPAGVGHEYQILDDARHPDAKLGHDGDRTIGSLYDLIPASKDKKVRPVGKWNTARIVVRSDNHVEHWLNGQKVVEYVRGSDDFKKTVAASKFKTIPGFGQWSSGHILLQEHGDAVSFRNIKIRTLQ